VVDDEQRIRAAAGQLEHGDRDVALDQLAVGVLEAHRHLEHPLGDIGARGTRAAEQDKTEEKPLQAALILAFGSGYG
jgi:hypothetical protein